jgi:hypothetical protein
MKFVKIFYFYRIINLPHKFHLYLERVIFIVKNDVQFKQTQKFKLHKLRKLLIRLNTEGDKDCGYFLIFFKHKIYAKNYNTLAIRASSLPFVQLKIKYQIDRLF